MVDVLSRVVGVSGDFGLWEGFLVSRFVIGMKDKG